MTALVVMIFVAVDCVLVLSVRLGWPVFGLVNTFFLSMHQDANFAFSRKKKKMYMRVMDISQYIMQVLLR